MQQNNITNLELHPIFMKNIFATIQQHQYPLLHLTKEQIEELANNTILIFQIENKYRLYIKKLLDEMLSLWPNERLYDADYKAIINGVIDSIIENPEFDWNEYNICDEINRVFNELTPETYIISPDA